MTKKHSSIRSIFTAFIIIQLVFAVDASPERIIFTQPDGSNFYGYNRGDEWAGWHETESGRPIIKKTDGWWVYAEDIIDNRLVGSNKRVKPQGDRSVAVSRLSKKLRPERVYPVNEVPIPNLQNARTTTFSVPLLLVDFPDFSYQYDAATFDTIMNSVGTYGYPGYPESGSFRDFYHEISYGQFDPVSTIAGWYEAPENHDYYADSISGDRVLTLVRAAVDSAEARGMDWSQFDNDGDGFVDALNIIHAGAGAEQGDYSNIWSHQWGLSAANLQVQYDGVWINSYTINPEIQGDNIVAIGVLCHEFGHALGLPDLYDTDYSSSGAGNLALMGSGSWGTAGNTPWYPSAMNAWSKTELGWSNVLTLSSAQSSVEVEQSFSSNIVYRVDHVSDDSEYWLIENRQKVGTDIYMPSPGLLFWHIDTEKTQDWGVNDDEPHYGVGLEQADGLYDLESGGWGDGGDPFPGTTNNINFSYNTVPSTESYYFQPSMITMNNISGPDSIMTFDLSFNDSLLVVMGIEDNTGPANDTGYIALTIDNKMVIRSMSFQLRFTPDIFDIVSIEALGRTTVDSITATNGLVELHNPAIRTGTGEFLRIQLFTNSTASDSAIIEYEWVQAEDENGDGIAFQLDTGIFIITEELATDDQNTTPDAYIISANYPNPFNPSTSLDYTLPQGSDVTIRLFDITGSLVMETHEYQHPGTYTFTWHGKDMRNTPVSSGLYFLQFNAGSFHKTQKLILMK